MKSKLNQRGGAAIAFIILAAVAAGAYIMRTTGLIQRGAERTAQVRLGHQVDSIGKGFLNYTIYAVKERWCMDESWGRDVLCGSGEMKKVVYHPRNLERLLWSKVAIDGICDRYIAKYGEAPPSPLYLRELKTVVSMEKLTTLGDQHPFNLIIPNNIKHCFSHLTIDLSIPANSANYLQGDEVALHIKSQFTSSKNKAKICERIGDDISSEAFVIFFPRTLNQFGVIKVGDFDISKIKGRRSDGGVHFWGDTYVQNDLIVPGRGYSPTESL